jgi:uncharacterized protein YicC (UPF0701 family)
VFNQTVRNKRLQAAGIAVPESEIPEPSVHQCSNCNYVNSFETEICERCSSPLTRRAVERIKKQQESKITGLVDQKVAEMVSKSKQEIRDQFQAYESQMTEFVYDIQGRLNQVEASKSSHNFMLDRMREILDRTAPNWFEEVFGPKAS